LRPAAAVPYEYPVPDVSAVVVAYGAEPWLERSVDACLASTGVDVEVVVVDNGCTDGAIDRLDGRPGVVVLRPGTNTGFAGGGNAGVAAAAARLVALVNPDALVDPGALAALAAVATRPEVGIATASVRLADRPELLNSAGNEIHFTGVSWSGAFEEPASAHDAETDTLAASGACCLLRREVWERLGGFDETFFAYYEDAQLSLRCWQLGLRVRFVPAAVAHHRYEFSRRPQKMELLERNRWQLLLTCFAGRTLALLAPVLAVLEVGFLAMAVAQGWAPQKLRSWRWLVAHRADIRRRRRAVQAARVVSDAELAPLLAVDLLPGNLPPPAWFRPVNAGLRAYWALVRRFV
jgi:GT2 family glycosyltransferase